MSDKTVETQFVSKTSILKTFPSPFPSKTMFIFLFPGLEGSQRLYNIEFGFWTYQRIDVEGLSKSIIIL